MSPINFLKRLVPEGWIRKLHEGTVARSVRQVWGPKSIRLARNEAAVVCLVKNGEAYLESFIEYYLRLGFRHVFFLDNGSSDQTIPIAKRYKDVSVCECGLRADKYERAFRKYLAQKSIVGGWCLWADTDEFFDYPGSDAVGLTALLEYLNQHHYTAVITQLLDMFSDKPLSHLTTGQKEDLQATYKFYDVSAVRKTDYRRCDLAAAFGGRNELSNEGIQIYSGGIRKTLYDNDCLLTKHSLFRPGSGLKAFSHLHFVDKARVADLSCVMLHYKFTSSAQHAAARNKEGFNLRGYHDFLELLHNKPEQRIKQNGAREFRSVQELVESGFLVVSPEYLKYARECEGAGGQSASLGAALPMNRP